MTKHEYLKNDEARMTKREVRHECRRMSADQRARYARLAREVEQEFPPGKAVPSRDPELPASLGDYFDLRSLVGELRRAREAQELSLAELARITGIDRAALSRIESGENLNPTISTLARYAQAVGRRIRFSLDGGGGRRPRAGSGPRDFGAPKSPMSKRMSPKPAAFADQREQHYWHAAQDIAFRAGVSLVARGGATWLIHDEGERLVCEPTRPERIWYETWLVLE